MTKGKYRITYIDSMSGECKILKVEAVDFAQAHRIAKTKMGVLDFVNEIVEIPKYDLWYEMILEHSTARKICNMLRSEGVYFEPSECSNYTHIEIHVTDEFENRFVDTLFDLAKILEMRWKW